MPGKHILIILIFSLVINRLFVCFFLFSINKKEMSDKRIRISLSEKRKYCELIEEEVGEENKTKEKTFSQPKITTFFNQ